MANPPATPAGWYPDPHGPPGQQRYWDGQEWTDRAAVKKSEGPDAWLMGGIVGGLLFPLIGLVIAIILFAKNRASHGAAVLVCCVIGLLIGVAVLWQ